MAKVNANTKPNTAVCLMGGPRAIALTAESIRIHLLDVWDADAFVLTHADADQQAREAASLREQIGPRVVSLSFRRGLNAQGSQAWWLTSKHATAWKVHGHPVEQYAARLACISDVRRYEARRNSSAAHSAGLQHRPNYEFLIRLRMDVLLLQPVPLNYQLELRRTPCSVLVPSGEDYTGLNDRLLLGTTCGFEADASITTFMASIGDRHLTETWNPEVANLRNLLASRTPLLRRVFAHCLVDGDGACRMRAELAASLRLLPSLLEERPYLCGALLLNAGPCDPRRIYYAGIRIVADDEGRAQDPGFCSLQKQCMLLTAPPRPALCMGDGSVVSDGNLIAIGPSTNWHSSPVWWRPNDAPILGQSGARANEGCHARRVLDELQRGAVRPSYVCSLGGSFGAMAAIVRGAPSVATWTKSQFQLHPTLPARHPTATLHTLGRCLAPSNMR